MDEVSRQEHDDALRNCMLTMAVESWRLGRVFTEAVKKLSEKEQSRYESPIRWFHVSLEETLAAAGMRIVNVEGMAFNAGLAVTPLNIEDFERNDDLIVDRMLEPVITGPHGIIRTGTVLLKRSQNE